MGNYGRDSRDNNRGGRDSSREGFGGGRSSGRGNDREMFDAICADCGDDCKVPFRPSSDKPIYCSRCFEKHDPRGEMPSRGRRESFDRGARDSGRGGFGGDRSRGRDNDREMFKTVCDKCGKNCEVPFKPSGDKPVYCSDCFSDNKPVSTGNSSNVNVEELKEQIELLNAKMDEIIKALKPVMPKKVVDEKGAETVEFKERKTVRAKEKTEKLSLK